jgi:hypothetical protein
MSHTSTKGRTPAVAALTIALLACTGLAACGGSSSTSTQTTANAAATGTTTPGTTSPGTSSTSTAPVGRPNPARFTTVRACLAKKGIVLPPRTPGAGGFLGGGPQLPKGVTRAQYAEALKSCGGANFPGRGHFSRVPHAFTSSRFHEVLARFAACLRQNGINVGEPNTSGKGPVFNTKGLNTGSTQFKAAEAKCRSTLLAGLRARPTGHLKGPVEAHPGAAGETG